jgi:hypothetical protein
MAMLDCINLNRRYGKVLPDRPARNETEFRALAVALKGIDDLFEGREPTPEFRQNFLESEQVQQALLVFLPAGKII